jgi:hypothetical protein
LTLDQVGIISFNDENGVTYPVRDKKDIDTWQTGLTIDIHQGEDIDEIASRQEYFGNGSEDLSYAIIEANIESMVEQGFDVGKLKKIIIPVIGG